jgi:hypothetical protein
MYCLPNGEAKTSAHADYRDNNRHTGWNWFDHYLNTLPVSITPSHSPSFCAARVCFDHHDKPDFQHFFYLKSCNGPSFDLLRVDAEPFERMRNV